MAQDEQNRIEIAVMNGVNDGCVYYFTAQKAITIGCDKECDIALDTDAAVSRHHATLQWSEGTWWLKDEGSQNGTYIEHYSTLRRHVKVRNRVKLRGGQLFRVGKTWLRFRVYGWAVDVDV